MALAGEILSLINKKGNVEIGEIQDLFSLNKETTYTITLFLVKFGFAEWDKNKKYIRLSKMYKRFLEETEAD